MDCVIHYLFFGLDDGRAVSLETEVVQRVPEGDVLVICGHRFDGGGEKPLPVELPRNRSAAARLDALLDAEPTLKERRVNAR